MAPNDVLAEILTMKRQATRLLIVCGALIWLTLFAAAAAAAAPARSGVAKGSLLYVQETAGGSIERLGAGVYRLRLTGVSPRVTTFTDRPRRRASRQGLEAFLSSWGANGFAADPPNAALVLDRAPAARDVALLTLSHPRYDRARRTLTYRATPLRGRDSALAPFARRADPVSAGKLGGASLFIDDGGALANVTFDVSGEATTTTVRFLVTGGAWSLAPRSALSIAGTFSMTGFYATQSSLSLQLLPNSPLGFGLSLPIEALGTEAPMVEATNLTGTITVTWPTDTGLETQVLTPGAPLPLNGLAP